MLSRGALLSYLSLVVVACGCTRSESGSDPGSAGSAAKAATSASARGSADVPLVLARGIRFVKAASGDVPTLVRAERDKAAGDGRDLLVYVGATWCEPCQRFHHAAQTGELDTEFPNLTILEFDLDQDRDRVFEAGYKSQLIPLFVRPGADGRGSSQRFEGGLKGDGAVANITPRLHKLLPTQ